MHPYILGIDFGTGSTKAVAVAKSGAVLFATQVYYPESMGHTEQDPQVIWKAFVQCTNEVLKKLETLPAAVALSSAMHSIMAVDALGTPVSPLITWADDRADLIAQTLMKAPEGKDFYEQCGTPIHAMSPLCKIAWWRQHDPQLFSTAHKFVGIKEWIWHKLFGVFETDYSLASATGMLHLATCTWYPPALRFLGIEATRLSQPVPTFFQRTGLDSTTAHQLGIPAETPFIIGASDGCLANLGTGALRKGIAAVTVGTSGAVRVACRHPFPQWPEQLFNYYLEEGLWITGGATNNGGSAVNWIAELLYKDGLNEAPFGKMQAIVPGCEGLLFVPFLLGERAPVWDSNSSAAFIGLRQHHTQVHLLKAVLEGVCFALRSILEPLETTSGVVEKLHLSGGFSRSSEALQLLADSTGKTVVRLQAEDASAIGAAYLAFKVLGWVNDFIQLPLPASLEHFFPDQNRHEQYNQVFEIYKTLYPALKSSMHRLRELGSR